MRDMGRVGGSKGAQIDVNTVYLFIESSKLKTRLKNKHKSHYIKINFCAHP